MLQNWTTEYILEKYTDHREMMIATHLKTNVFYEIVVELNLLFIIEVYLTEA